MRPITAAQLQAQRSFSPRARVSVEARAWGDFDQGAYSWEVISRQLPAAVLEASVRGSSFHTVYSGTVGLAGGLACRAFHIPNRQRTYIQRGIYARNNRSWETTPIEKEYEDHGGVTAPPAIYVDRGDIYVNILRGNYLQYVRWDGGWDTEVQRYSGNHGKTIRGGFYTAANSGYGRIYLSTRQSTHRGESHRPHLFRVDGDGRLEAFGGVGPNGHLAAGLRLHPYERSMTVYTVNGGSLWSASFVDETWGDPVLMDDLADDEAAVAAANFGVGPGGDIFWRQEKLGSVYDAVGVVQGDQPVVSEAILWPGWRGGELIDQGGVQPVKIGGDYYLVAADFVARAVLLPAAARALPTPVKYQYRQKIVGLEQSSLQGEGSSGRAEFTFPAKTVVDVGEMLLVRRTLEAPGGQGADSVVFLWVAAVESERTEVRVVALDPVGVLGVVRPRVGVRFHIRTINRRLVPLRYTYIVRHLIARAGLPARIDVESTISQRFTFTIPANENLRSALYRINRVTQYWYYRPDPETGSMAIQVLPGPRAADGAGYSYGAGAHPIIRRVDLQSALALGLVVMRGKAVDRNPQLDHDWQAADGPRVGHVRPRPISYENLKLLNEHARLEFAVASESEYLRRQKAVVFLEAVANLSLELYDQVRLDGELFQVVSIIEEWDRGRLLHSLELAAPEA